MTGKVGSHTRSSEPFFYDTAYTHNKHMGVIPVATNGFCVVAKEIKTKAPDTNLVIERPYAWGCTDQCKLLSSEEVQLVLTTKSLFTKPVVDIRATLDSGYLFCHVHRDLNSVKGQLGSRMSELRGHPIVCEFPTCPSTMRVLQSGSVHYPVMHNLLRLVYSALRPHKNILGIHKALALGDVEALLKFLECKQLSTLFHENVTDHQTFCDDNSKPGLGSMENHLKVTHAELIADLEAQFKDDPVYPCLSCARLHHRKQVSGVNFTNEKKYKTGVLNSLWVIPRMIFMCARIVVCIPQQEYHAATVYSQRLDN